MKRLVYPIILLFILLTSSLHHFYPDEFENILGAKNVLSGRLPYTGFFTQHNPLPYIAAVPLYIMANGSFPRFRLLYAVLIFGLYIWLTKWGYKFVGKKFGRTISILTILLAVGSTFDWTHMYIADSISALLLLPGYLILISSLIRTSPLTPHQHKIIALSATATLWTSLTQIYTVAILVSVSLLHTWKSERSFSQIKRYILYLSLPIFYLLITGSLKQFYLQSIHFNVAYYAYLPDNISTHNPLRIAVVILVHFFQQFKTSLLMTKDLNIGFPYIVTLALANFSLLAYAIYKKRYLAAVALWLLLSFSCARADPYTTTETDYQAAVYHILSITNLFLSLYFWLFHSKKNLLSQSLILITAIYTLALSIFLTDKWLDKSYTKYMGTQPLIYDRPAIANFVNDYVSKKQTYFLGPFDPQEHLYINRTPASRYQMILPGMDKDQTMQNQIIQDIQTNKPALVIFDTEQRLYSMKPGEFLTKYIFDNYQNLDQIGTPCNGWIASTKWYGHFDAERHIFYPKQDNNKLLQSLADKKIIQKISPEEIKKIPRCNQTKNS